MSSESQAGGTRRPFRSVEDFRREYNLGRTLTYEAIRRGEIPHIRIGRRILIPDDALDRLLSSPEPAGTAPGSSDRAA